MLVRKLLETGAYRYGISGVVVVGWVLCCVEISARSAQRTEYWNEHNYSIDGFQYKPEIKLEVLNLVAVVVFGIDCILRFYVQPRSYFHRLPNILDTVCVLVDVTLICLAEVSDAPALHWMRIFRALKLVRAIRTSSVFRDLYLMLEGLHAAIRPITFAVIMLMFFLSFCAVVAVEFVHMDNMENQREGVYGDCPDHICKAAFSSVWYAMMTLFKTIIAGDSWGQMNYALVTEKPYHAALLLGSILMIQVGMLNLIVAVMVDRIYLARQRDEEYLLSEKRDSYEFTRERLRGLYASIDTDNTGSVSVADMHAAYKSLPLFRFILDTLDVREWEMEIVFQIFDVNQDDRINFDEFVATLYDLKSRNPTTLLMYIKHNTGQLLSMMKRTSKRIDDHEASLHKMSSAVLKRFARSCEGTASGSGRGGGAPEVGATPAGAEVVLKRGATSRSTAPAALGVTAIGEGGPCPDGGLQEVDARSAATSSPRSRISLDGPSCASDSALLTSAELVLTELEHQMEHVASSSASSSPASSPRGGGAGVARRPPATPKGRHRSVNGGSALDVLAHPAHRPAGASGDGSCAPQAEEEMPLARHGLEAQDEAGSDKDPGHRSRGRTHKLPRASVPPSSKSLGVDIVASSTAHDHELRTGSRPGNGDARGPLALGAGSVAEDPAFECGGSLFEASRWRDRVPRA